MGAWWRMPRHRSSEAFYILGGEYRPPLAEGPLTELDRSRDQGNSNDRNGSGCDGEPFGFIARKPALKARCP